MVLNPFLMYYECAVRCLNKNLNLSFCCCTQSYVEGMFNNENIWVDIAFRVNITTTVLTNKSKQDYGEEMKMYKIYCADWDMFNRKLSNTISGSLEVLSWRESFSISRRWRVSLLVLPRAEENILSKKYWTSLKNISLAFFI